MILGMLQLEIFTSAILTANFGYERKNKTEIV